MQNDSTVLEFFFFLSSARIFPCAARYNRVIHTRACCVWITKHNAQTMNHMCVRGARIHMGVWPQTTITRGTLFRVRSNIRNRQCNECMRSQTRTQMLRTVARGQNVDVATPTARSVLWQQAMSYRRVTARRAIELFENWKNCIRSKYTIIRRIISHHTSSAGTQFLRDGSSMKREWPVTDITRSRGDERVYDAIVVYYTKRTDCRSLFDLCEKM